MSQLIEVKEEKSFLYAESKRAKAEREKEERRQKMEEDFSPEDLALATVPGYDFDPKERTLIFVQTKKNADFLATYLSGEGLPTTSIHGDR